ncbi:MAG: FG-GAP repeat protein, partial [Phycisphaerales bacterium]
MMKIGSFVAALLACVSSVASAQRSTPVQVLHPAAAAGDQFARAVAISGDTMLVGVPSDDIGAFTDQGSVQVYRWTGSGWTWEASLVASDGAIGDGFGYAVAISGDTVIVGAYLDDVGANPEQGSAYVFVRSGTTWTQQAKLTASDGASIDLFGQSVAIFGDTVIIGAFADEINGVPSQGSAYVFNRSGTAWTQQAKLTASDGASADYFGWTVELFGDYAIVGAPNDDVGANADQGSAYVFARSGAAWTQQSKITSTDGAAG